MKEIVLPKGLLMVTMLLPSLLRVTVLIALKSAAGHSEMAGLALHMGPLLPNPTRPLRPARRVID